MVLKTESPCIFCGMPVDDDHHVIAKTLLRALPNLSNDDIRTIKTSTLPICRLHHDMIDELARIYVHIIRCALERRPYHLSTTVPHRLMNLTNLSRKNNTLIRIVDKLDIIIQQTRKER